MYIHQETQSRLRRYAYAAGYSTHGRSGKALASFIDKLLDCWEEKLKLENENWDWQTIQETTKNFRAAQIQDRSAST